MSLLLKNCRLIPALSDGYDETYADVKVEDGKIEEVRENKASGKDILDDAFSLVENKDLYGLSDLYAKHFKEG